ncbi:hypothetical protein KDA_53290 [Dictyobacter alpinus]|uniref:Uncharacterized protein n=1 Tax=Dictyobacter alpinus TaxID=2014873 RepID=A0A402BEP9_9CHLR|nr:hypothetical protein [Dictyobacter alpinus]GCE29845.1 hypothetical protein KDA_53290 [Dictyobacter alpinus]
MQAPFSRFVVPIEKEGSDPTLAFLPSAVVLVGNILGLLVGFAVGVLGYVAVVAIITGKQRNGK